MLCCCTIKGSQGFKTVAAPPEGGKQLSMAKAHNLLGHSNHRTTVDTVKHLGLRKLKDSGVMCQPCAKSKIQAEVGTSI